MIIHVQHGFGYWIPTPEHLFHLPMNLFRGKSPIVKVNLNCNQKRLNFFLVVFRIIFEIFLSHSFRLLVVPRLTFISRATLFLNPLEMKAFVSCILYRFGHQKYFDLILYWAIITFDRFEKKFSLHFRLENDAFKKLTFK